MINYNSLIKVLKDAGYRKSNETEENGKTMVDFTNTRKPKILYTALLNPKYPGAAEKVVKTVVKDDYQSLIPINGLVELKTDLGL